MAYMTNLYAFEGNINNSEYDVLQTCAGILVDGDMNPVEQKPGILCVRHSRTANAGYGTDKNTNTWYFQKASSIDDAELWAVYPSESDITAVYGHDYRITPLTLGTSVPAGRRCRYIKIVPGGTYTFGPANFSAIPAANEIYAQIGTGASAGLLVPTSTKPTSGVVFGDIYAYNFTAGNRPAGTGYTVRAGLSLYMTRKPDAPTITTPSTSTAASSADTFSMAGANVSGAEVHVYIDGVYAADATVSGIGWTYSLATAEGSEQVVTLRQEVGGMTSEASDAVTITRS